MKNSDEKTDKPSSRPPKPRTTIRGPMRQYTYGEQVTMKQLLDEFMVAVAKVEDDKAREIRGRLLELIGLAFK